ncbi:winged helix DNA-binding domain-containing protein [Spirillospora sp. NPDC050679]
MSRVLSRRELNRATLERQLLLRRHRTDPAAAVEHLVGLHSQLPQNPYTALWSRLESFDAEDFSASIEERRIVRISLHRSTIHTVTARDCLALRPVLQAPQDRTLKAAFGRKLAGVDTDLAVRRAREMVEARPMTFNEIGKALIDQWPDSTVQALGMLARHRLPMVQVPPRGLWRRGGAARHTTAEHWLGAPQAAADAPDELFMRYLAAFGPASVMDAQQWCGLTRLNEVADRHRADLITFRDEDGTELFDLPDAPRPGGDAPAPPRFLPEFDNVFIGHRDRTRILTDEAKRHIWPGGNIVRAPFLIDGFVAGTWETQIDTKRGRATLALSPFIALTTDQREALEEEGRRLLGLHAPGIEHEITEHPA